MSRIISQVLMESDESDDGDEGEFQEKPTLRALPSTSKPKEKERTHDEVKVAVTAHRQKEGSKKRVQPIDAASYFAEFSKGKKGARGGVQIACCLCGSDSHLSFPPRREATTGEERSDCAG